MQLWLLDYLATSLDFSIILGLYTIGRDCCLIKDQWRSFNDDILRVDLTSFSQPCFYRFIYDSSGGKTNISFCAQTSDKKRRLEIV